jgi:hypothetical protein
MKNHEQMAQIMLAEQCHQVLFQNSIIRNHVGINNQFLQDTMEIDFTALSG